MDDINSAECITRSNRRNPIDLLPQRQRLMARKWRAHGLLVCAAIIYSVYNVALAKTLASTKVSATGLSLFREVVAVPMLYVWAWRAERLSGWPAEAGRFLALGCILGAFQLCFVIGVSLTDATSAAVLQCVEPSTAAVIGACFGGERCTGKKLLSALAAGAGVAALQIDLATGTLDSTSSRSAFVRGVGYVLLFCQGVGISFYCLIQKVLVRGSSSLETLGAPLLRPTQIYGPITVTAHAYLISLGIMTIAASVSTACAIESPPPLSRRGLSALSTPPILLVVAYSAVFSSVVGYSMRAEANKTLDTSTLVLYNALQPPLTALADKMINPHSARYGLNEFVATFLVVAAVILAASDRQPKVGEYDTTFLAAPSVGANTRDGANATTPRLLASSRATTSATES